MNNSNRSNESEFRIIEILDNKDKASQIGQRAKSFVRKDFTLDKMVAQTVEIYQKALEK